MRSVIIILLLVANTSFGQDYLFNRQIDPKYPTKIVLRDEGWFTISLGTTILASSYFIHYAYGTNGVDPKVRTGGLVFATTIGVGLHVISWKRENIKHYPKF